MPMNLIFEKHTKVFVKSLWILLSLLIIFTFGIKPPKVSSTAFAQIDPKDLTLAPISILLPPAAFLLVCATTINVAQATVVVIVRCEHCA